VSPSSWLVGWRLTAVRILAFLAVVAITAYVYAIRSEAAKLAAYGYPGIFLLSILANATVILPAPGIAITFAMGAIFNPIGVALAAGSGAAIGELTGYMTGFSGQGVAEKSKVYQRLESWTRDYGGWTILILAFIPNPLFDMAGMAAGALRMPLPRFLLFTWIGKVLKMAVFAYAGAYSVSWLAGLFR
jgi:membrane protein DedA with SNARE-associated domain